MMTARRTLPALQARRGRHAIQRARSFADACRLRHAQVLLPRGLYRTRVSEMRGRGVRVPAKLAGRHPFPVAERAEAMRLPLSMG